MCFFFVINAATDDELSKISRLLKYCQTDSNGKGFPAGYHTVIIDGQKIQGRRDPLIRLSHVPYDFHNKVVLDIGSNIGGMLFAIADQIKYGVGIDYNYRAINVANRLKSHYELRNINFFVFDLMKEPLSVIGDFLPEHRVDICFFLAMGMWLKNWREVIGYIASISDAMLLETNGDASRQEATVSYARKLFSKVTLITSQSGDDLKGNYRKMYLCFK